MVADITTNFLATFNAVIAGVGSGIVELFEELIIHRDAGVDTIMDTADDVLTLSSFGLWMFALMGLGLAIGIFTRLLNKVA